jgi:hypothetical protein
LAVQALIHGGGISVVTLSLIVWHRNTVEILWKSLLTTGAAVHGAGIAVIAISAVARQAVPAARLATLNLGTERLACREAQLQATHVHRDAFLAFRATTGLAAAIVITAVHGPAIHGDASHFDTVHAFDILVTGGLGLVVVNHLTGNPDSYLCICPKGNVADVTCFPGLRGTSESHHEQRHCHRHRESLHHRPHCRQSLHGISHRFQAKHTLHGLRCKGPCEEAASESRARHWRFAALTRSPMYRTRSPLTPRMPATSDLSYLSSFGKPHL